MNPRIKELMESCFDITVDSRGREDCSADYINVQRFAELIVQECANIVRNSSLPDSYSEACLRNIADELEELFGVEE